jgi:hypothetical protein
LSTLGRLDLTRPHALQPNLIDQTRSIDTQIVCLLAIPIVTTYRPHVFWTTLSVAVLAIVALSGASIVIYTMGNGIPPSPTGGKAKQVLLQAIEEIGASGKVCELGVGWGTLALPIADRYPKIQLIGYENSPVPYWIARIRASLQGKGIHIERANFLDVDLRDIDLIICYQSPSIMSKLRLKFDAELKDSAYVVSNTFALPGWKPIRTEIVPDVYRTKVYIYRKIDSKPLTTAT